MFKTNWSSHLNLQTWLRMEEAREDRGATVGRVEAVVEPTNG